MVDQRVVKRKMLWLSAVAESDLTKGECNVLYRLLDYTDRDFRISATVSEIAAETDWDLSNTRRVINSVESRGWVSRLWDGHFALTQPLP